MFKQIRFLLRFARALLGKYYLAIFGGVILSTLAIILAPRIIPMLPKIRTTQNIAVVGRFTQADIPLSIQQKISLGLTNVGSDGNPVPAIANKWAVQDGGKTYIFSIDQSLRWQDGTQIKSQDIKYNFKDIIIEYPNDQNIIIRLVDPFTPLPTVVSRPIFKTGLVGAGKYHVVKMKRNGQIIESLTLSPLDQDSRLPRLKYNFYASEQQARLAFKLGLVRSIEDIQEVTEIASWPGATLTPAVRHDRFVAIFFNTEDAAFSGMSGKNLRLALAYAIDKSIWKDRAYGPINPNSWAFNADLKRYDLDLDHSRELLTRVEKIPDEITISTIPLYLPVAEKVKADWEKLGIASKVLVVPEITTDFSVLVMAQAIPTDPDQYNLWHSTQGTNLTRFHNPRIDKLLEDGRKSLDPTERRTIYVDFQKFLVEEAPALFLFHPTTYTLSKT